MAYSQIEIKELLRGFFPKDFSVKKPIICDDGYIMFGHRRYPITEEEMSLSPLFLLYQNSLSGTCLCRPEEHGRFRVHVTTVEKIGEMLTASGYKIKQWDSHRKVQIGEDLCAIFPTIYEDSFGSKLAGIHYSKVERVESGLNGWICNEDVLPVMKKHWRLLVNFF